MSVLPLAGLAHGHERNTSGREPASHCDHSAELQVAVMMFSMSAVVPAGAVGHRERCHRIVKKAF